MSFLDALNSLSMMGPPQSQQAQQEKMAAAGVAKAPGNVSTTQAVQQVAPALAQAQGQVAGQQMQRQQQMAGQLAGQQLQQEGFQGQQRLAQQGLRQQGQLGQQQRQAQAQGQRREQDVTRELTEKEQLQQQTLQQFGIDQDNQILQLNLQTRRDLDTIGSDLQDKLIDSRRRFERDEWGRKFQNERQLADYAIASAQDELDLQLKLQGMQQSFQRSTQVLQAAHQKIVQQLQQQSTRKIQAGEQQLQEELAYQKAALKRKIARQQAKSQAIGNIVKGGIMVGTALLTGGMSLAAYGVLAGTAGVAGYAATEEDEI